MRLIRALLRLLMVLTLVVVVATPVAVLYLKDGPRSFVVEARTLGATVTPAEGASWELRGAVVCKLRERPVAVTEPGPCPGALYEFDDPAVLELTWPPTSEERVAEVEWLQGGGLRIRVRGAGGVPDGSVVFLRRDAADATGALAFDGTVAIGGPMGTGARNFLIEGTYRARQLQAAHALFGRGTDTIMSGTLMRGDTVRIFDGDAPAQSFGHISGSTEDEPGFVLVAVSRFGDVELRVGYHGTGVEPAVLKPTWVNVVLANPTLLGVAAILSMAVVAVQLIMSTTALLWQGGPQPALPARRDTGRSG